MGRHHLGERSYCLRIFIKDILRIQGVRRRSKIAGVRKRKNGGFL
jgi:hypothetical protein